MAAFVPARLRLVKEIPAGRGWLYEPKLDGYRGLLVTNDVGSLGAIYSRNDKDLSPYVPELVHLARAIPHGCVLDGEIVRPTEGGVSFFELQHRLAIPMAQRSSVAAATPVAFVAFDILKDRSEDVRGLRLSRRRKVLERITASVDSTLLQLIDQIDDAALAGSWLNSSMDGVEGVVAKPDGPYPAPTERRWHKVRRESTMEVLVQGFVVDGRESVRLVIGQRRGDESQVLGTTSPIPPNDAKAVLRLMPSSSPGERPTWTPFVKERIDEWFKLPSELVAEVIASNIDGGTLRHPARFVRWRFSDPRLVEGYSVERPRGG